MKKTYELTVIFTPVLREKGLTSAIASVEKLVKKHKGKILEMEDEGKAKMSYPIAKYQEGIYLFWKIEFSGENIHAFEAELALQQGVLRQLLIKSK
jgi:small subunit ribosomal protein S6